MLLIIVGAMVGIAGDGWPDGVVAETHARFEWAVKACQHSWVSCDAKYAVMKLGAVRFAYPAGGVLVPTSTTSSEERSDLS